MSLAWIKVNRKEKTHSVYSDGRAVKPDMTSILDENKDKTCAFDIDGKYSVVIGCAGVGFGISHIREHFPEYFKKQEEEYKYTKKRGKEFVRDLFENYTKDFKKIYKRYYLEADVVISVNGDLYKLYAQSGGGYECTEIKDVDFVCVGYPEVEANMILTYDNDADPQRMLSAIAKHNVSINDKLFKIENVQYYAS